MKNRRLLLLIVPLLALGLAVASTLTPLGQHSLISAGLIAARPSPTLRAAAPRSVPSPTATPSFTFGPAQTTPTPTAPAPDVSANAVYLLNLDTGTVLDDSAGEMPLPMASTTKIMTALIAIQTGDLDQLVTVGQDAQDRVIDDDGSSAGLIVGDQIPLKDLLYGLLLPSGDDAAVAIADALGNGSETAFVQRMNLFAYRLRLFQTHYVDADGLNSDSNHYSSARDLVRLASYAMNIPLFAQIVDTPTYHLDSTATHAAYSWSTTNNLLTTYPGMLGIKTGHTDAAGWCLVFEAQHNGEHVIGAILGSPSQDQRDQDVGTLLNWAFGISTNSAGT